MVVSTEEHRAQRAVLVMNFLFVAALYVLLARMFLAVIQILVYAGGIVVLYLFVVMLVNLKRPPRRIRIRTDEPARIRNGRGSAVELGAIAAYGSATTAPRPPVAATAAIPVSGNTEQVGLALYNELPDSVRDRVDAAAGGHDRRDRFWPEGPLIPEGS